MKKLTKILSVVISFCGGFLSMWPLFLLGVISFCVGLQYATISDIIYNFSYNINFDFPDLNIAVRILPIFMVLCYMLAAISLPRSPIAVILVGFLGIVVVLGIVITANNIFDWFIGLFWFLHAFHCFILAYQKKSFNNKMEVLKNDVQLYLGQKTKLSRLFDEGRYEVKYEPQEGLE